jgi:hypothetical protein
MIGFKKLKCKQWVEGFTVGGVYPVFKLSEGEFIYNDEGKRIGISDNPSFKISQIGSKSVAISKIN